MRTGGMHGLHKRKACPMENKKSKPNYEAIWTLGANWMTDWAAVNVKWQLTQSVVVYIYTSTLDHFHPSHLSFWQWWQPYARIVCCSSNREPSLLWIGRHSLSTLNTISFPYTAWCMSRLPATINREVLLAFFMRTLPQDGNPLLGYKVAHWCINLICR